MKNWKHYFLLAFIVVGCKPERIELKFLDEFVIKDSLLFKETVVGGISGIDFYNNQYYMVIDDARNPRVLVGDIIIEKEKISSINFKDLIKLNDTLTEFYKNNALDLESVFVSENGEINLVSEGSIRKSKNPAVFSINSKGGFLKDYKYPEYFKATSLSTPKHNGMFEGSSKSIDGKGFWVAMEAPLGVDGEEPTFHKTQSPIRITYYDNQTLKATKQFAYELDKIDKPAKGNINLNGVTSLLEYKKNTFFVIERAYQSGYGSYGNIVRIYKATADINTTNTLAINSLKEEEYVPLKKELLIDFSTIQDKLTDGIIDNIEGITFGPKLENGNQSLILVSDDNFQVYGKQLNQFILLEIIDK